MWTFCAGLEVLELWEQGLLRWKFVFHGFVDLWLAFKHVFVGLTLVTKLWT